ncbi:MAG: OmpA family protein [Deltaproteobacteria bacterium]|nr:OmpA family protein [Deltaproteobacteria bacterium]
MIRKNPRQDHHENSERWLISYADFITLLFAFFVVMYATSTNNIEKQKEFESSVRDNLHLAQKTNPSESGSASTISESLHELNHPIDNFPNNGSPREIKDYLQRKIDNSSDKLIKNSLTSLKHEWFGVRMSLASSSFFTPGSYKLKMSSLKLIDEIVKNLEKSKHKIIIEGHTDNIPIINSMIESNWELSSLRATTVVRYLLKYHHMDPTQLTAAAYADTRPLVPNDSEENRSKNRRIDFLVISDEKINKQGF